ncbi:hypothetical protein HMSSN036_50690 [Paenibacillus macerans]|nr:hypothetical protein HMSSN036_50690 [Paenibacillus macerans]
MLALSALEQRDMPGSQAAAPGVSAARADEAAWPLHRDQRFHTVLLAVKTAAEWLKFRSRIGFHIRLPPESRIHEHKFRFFHYTKRTFSYQAENLT